MDVEVVGADTQEIVTMNQKTHTKVGIAPTLSVSTATRREVCFTMAAPDGSSLIMHVGVELDNVVEIRDMLSAWIDVNQPVELDAVPLRDLYQEVIRRIKLVDPGIDTKAIESIASVIFTWLGHACSGKK